MQVNIYIMSLTNSIIMYDGQEDKGLVINYGEVGYKMGKLRVRNFLRPPPSRQGKTFRTPPPFKEGKVFCAPPSIWLRIQATA